MASGSSVSDMGELFMQRPNGQTTRIDREGTVTQTVEPLQIDWCDKCSKWQPLEGGEYTRYQGMTIIWLCEVCK
jgi:hypothetical protein